MVPALLTLEHQTLVHLLFLVSWLSRIEPSWLALPTLLEIGVTHPAPFLLAFVALLHLEQEPRLTNGAFVRMLTALASWIALDFAFA